MPFTRRAVASPVVLRVCLCGLRLTVGLASRRYGVSAMGWSAVDVHRITGELLNGAGELVIPRSAWDIHEGSGRPAWTATKTIGKSATEDDGTGRFRLPDGREFQVDVLVSSAGSHQGGSRIELSGHGGARPWEKSR